MLSARELALLDGAHPDLARVVFRAAEMAEADGRRLYVAEVLRSRERAAALASGPRPTGVVNSLHIAQHDGKSWAVDVWPAPKPDWTPAGLPAWDRLAGYMLAAADELGVLLQWGADWDTDGVPRERGEYDCPHFQRPVLPARIEGCKAAALRRKGARAGGEAWPL